MTVAKSPTEQIRDLALELRALTAREATFRDAVSDLKANDQKHRDEIAELRRELTDLRQENAVLEQQFQDHIKRVDLWDSRRWGLFVLLIAAVFSLASGPIVPLARK